MIWLSLKMLRLWYAIVLSFPPTGRGICRPSRNFSVHCPWKYTFLYRRRSGDFSALSSQVVRFMPETTRASKSGSQRREITLSLIHDTFSIVLIELRTFHGFFISRETRWLYSSCYNYLLISNNWEHDKNFLRHISIEKQSKSPIVPSAFSVDRRDKHSMCVTGEHWVLRSSEDQIRNTDGILNDIQ
jgi:hypothetical protein